MLPHISRDGDLELETEKGDILCGKEAVKDLREDWMGDRGRVNKNTRNTTHIVLSMPKGTNEKN